MINVCGAAASGEPGTEFGVELYPFTGVAACELGCECVYTAPLPCCGDCRHGSEVE